MSSITVGCCGFQRGMKEYFHQFKLVEVQQTFYQMPKLDTATRWRKEAPADFEFTMKAWQIITHPMSSPTYRRVGLKFAPGQIDRFGFFRPTEEVDLAWRETAKFARALQAKVIVFQCPPSFRENPENIDNMRRFFRNIGKPDFLYAWEERGDWSDATIKTLCAELGLIHCVDPFERASLFGEPEYFRLHGGPRYQHRFTSEELKWLKEKLRDKEAYVLFNNLNMYEDARTFIGLMGQGY